MSHTKTRTRQDKRNDFDDFYDKSEKIFKDLRDGDSRAEKFEREYMLNISPGSRNGGTDKRVIEVAWGFRNYEFETQGPNWKALTETGASLIFYRNDTGDITISIYPASTKFRKPFETSITLHIWLDPKKLKDGQFVLSLWNDFMAYMEFTSLDGSPTFLQRKRIYYLRTFKNLIIDNKWTPTKFSVFMSGLLKLVLAACFSGAVLIFLITHMTKPTTTETETQLKEVNKNLKTVSTQLDKISESNANIKTISIAADSVVIKTKEILKSIEKHKTK